MREHTGQFASAKTQMQAAPMFASLVARVSIDAPCSSAGRHTAYAGPRLDTEGEYLCLELLAVLTPPWAVLDVAPVFPAPS